MYSFPGVSIKKHFLFGTVAASFIYGFLFPLAGWALVNSVWIPFPIILLLFIFGLGSATLKDFEDVEGDIIHGVNTLPNILGNKAIYFVSSRLVILKW